MIQVVFFLTKNQNKSNNIKKIKHNKLKPFDELNEHNKLITSLSVFYFILFYFILLLLLLFFQVAFYEGDNNDVENRVNDR
jgi:cytoskeletal protein RodZ